MVFTDQMLQPRSVVQMPKGVIPPSVYLSTNKEDNAAELPASLPWSPLGIWYLDGCQQFLETAKAVLSYSSDKSEDDAYETLYRLVSIGAIQGSATEGRGRRNLNIKAVPPSNIDHFDSMTLPKSKAASKCMKMTHELQEQASKIASQVSNRMETWLSLPQGSMVKAHEQGYSSSLRLLDYPPGVPVHPHTDGSAYTIVYNDCSMAIQSLEEDGVWYELPPSKDSSRLLLMLGSHLDQAIPKRLSQIGCDGIIPPDLEKLRAPVHRLNAIANPRRALTLHVKADTTWPHTLEKLNGSNYKSESGVLLEANDYHQRDIAWDAELFSHYLCNKSVPSAKDVLDHLALLASLVEGCDVRTCKEDDAVCSVSSTDSSPTVIDDATPCPTKKEAYLLPGVHCTGYWQLQTERYSAFLRIHKRYPSKAVKMLPPREIHHVWLCHQLHPLRYKADSIKLIGKILDHANSNFCLDGCPIFHQLWLEETGESWPSRANLRREATKAKEIPEVASNQEDLDYISANLWHNYDGLTRLYFELQGEAPELFASGLDQQVLLLKEARLEYARFLIASSYAATVGMTVTPSGLVDLVWHTHQTDPKGYDCTIQREFSTGPIDHVPCGALNPPPDDGKEWLEMTDKIWIDLFGKGVNVQGQAIHCCTPQNSRPERAVVQGTELVWWFPASTQLGKPCIGNCHGFLSLQEAIATMTTAEESQVHRHVLAPLLEAMENVLQAHKEELASIKSSSEYRLNRVCMFVCILVFVVVMVVPWIVLSQFRGKQQRMTDGQAAAMMVISLCVAPFPILRAACILSNKHDSLLGQVRVNFWSQISAQVDSFNECAAEFNICVMFVQDKNGPVDPSHTENDLYKGPALVLTRCLPPNEGSRDNTLASVEAGQSLDYENGEQDTLEEEKEDRAIPGLP